MIYFQRRINHPFLLYIFRKNSIHLLILLVAHSKSTRRSPLNPCGVFFFGFAYGEHMEAFSMNFV